MKSKQDPINEISLTPLATQMIVGGLPRTTLNRVPVIDKVDAAKVGAWARSKNPLGDVGHYLWHKLRLSARQIDQWRNIEDPDPTKLRQKASNYVCTVYGGTVWQRIEQAINAIQTGDVSVLRRPLQVVENHAEVDPLKTRLQLCDMDIVPWMAAALLDLQVEAWVGFSAVRHDQPRYDSKPSMCGLTVELAARMH